MSRPVPATRMTARQALVLACAASATYLAASMGGSISLVLPQMAAALNATAADIQWIISGYLLARISALRPAGILCDIIGARRVFLAGMACFAVTSALCGWADSESLLIPLRMLQGAFAAVLSPSALILLREAVPSERQAFAMGIWSAAGMAGFGIAPVLGGALVHAWGWRSVFLFTAALTLLLAIVAATLGRQPAAVQQPRTPQRGALRQELPTSAALAALAYFIGQHNTVLALGVAAVSIAVMGSLLWKRRKTLSSAAWLPWLRILPYVGIGAFGFAAIAGVMLWASYFIQRDLNQSAFLFGMACLPMAVMGMAASFGTEPLIAAKRSNLAFLLGGLATVALGLSAGWAHTTSMATLAGLALMFAGLCYGFTNASVTSRVMDAFPPALAGDASATATLSKQFGQLIGVTAVASFRDLSGKGAGDDTRVFYFFALCGVIIILCAGVNALLDTRRRQVIHQANPR